VLGNSRCCKRKKLCTSSTRRPFHTKEKGVKQRGLLLFKGRRCRKGEATSLSAPQQFDLKITRGHWEKGDMKALKILEFPRASERAFGYAKKKMKKAGRKEKEKEASFGTGVKKKHGVSWGGSAGWVQPQEVR